MFKFDLKAAWKELKNDFEIGSNKEKATSIAKLVGKTVFNTGARFIEETMKVSAEAKEKAGSLSSASDNELIELYRKNGNMATRLAAKKVLSERYPDKFK